MVGNYQTFSFMSPADQQQFDRYTNGADFMQQAAMSPAVDPRGSYSATEGLGQLAQALASVQLRKRAQAMQQPKPQMMDGSGLMGGIFGGMG